MAALHRVLSVNLPQSLFAAPLDALPCDEDGAAGPPPTDFGRPRVLAAHWLRGTDGHLVCHWAQDAACHNISRELSSQHT